MKNKVNWFLLILIGTGLSFWVSAQSHDRVVLNNPVEDIVAYANYCAELVEAPIPDFNCIDDGVEIPITVNGQLSTEENPEQCDKPGLMWLAGGNRCHTGSRVGRIKHDNEDALTAFICRRTHRPSLGKETFQEVAIIHHNRRSGATCFFNALPTDDASGIFETDVDAEVISPMNSYSPNAMNSPVEIEKQLGLEKFNIKIAEGATSFWGSNRRVDCQECHYPDPFLHTPYIRQATISGRAVVPSVYEGTDGRPQPYWTPFPSIFNIINDATLHFGPNQPGGKCTVCHALGANDADLNRLTAQAVGRYMDEFITSNDLGPNPSTDFQFIFGANPRLAWMHFDAPIFHLQPPSNEAIASVKQIIDCRMAIAGRGPRLPQSTCWEEPIPGRPPYEIDIVEPNPERVPTLVPGVTIPLRATYGLHDMGDRIRWRIKVPRRAWERLPRRTKSGERLLWVPRCRPGDPVEIVAELESPNGRIQQYKENSNLVAARIETFCESASTIFWRPRDQVLESIPVADLSLVVAGDASGRGNIATSNIKIGDSRQNLQYRSYLSFLIEPPQKGFRVKQATLSLRLLEGKGTVAGNFGNLLVSHYLYGDRQTVKFSDPALFREGLARSDATITGIDLSTNTHVALKKLDVTRAVQVAMENNQSQLQLTIRLSKFSDNDNAEDTLYIQNQPRGDGLGSIDLEASLQPYLEIMFE